MLNDVFDKIICINLERRKDRWNQSCSEFAKHGIEVERFSAFDHEEFQNIYNQYDVYQRASLGCSLSHVAVLKSAKSRGFKNVLILEDDAEFHDQFNEIFNQVSPQIPENWNMIYFGPNRGSDCRPIKVSENIFRASDLLTTHAYAVNENTYDILIKAGQNFIHGIDTNYVNYVQPRVNCYLINPPLIFQRSDYSDLQMKNVDYVSFRYEIPQ